MAHSTAYEFQWNSAYELCIWHTEGTLVRLRHTEGRLVRLRHTEGRLVRLRHTAQRTNSNEPCYMAHGRYTGTYGTDNVRLHISYACAPTCVCVSRFAVCLVCFFAKWAHCESTRQLHTQATHARYTRKLHTQATYHTCHICHTYHIYHTLPHISYMPHMPQISYSPPSKREIPPKNTHTIHDKRQTPGTSEDP